MILYKRYPVRFGVKLFERMFIILGLFFVQPAIAALNNELCVPQTVTVTIELFSLDNYRGGWFNLTCSNWNRPVNISLSDNAQPYFNIQETSTSISGQYRLIPKTTGAFQNQTYITVKNESMSTINLIPLIITVKKTIRTAHVFPINVPFIIDEKLPVGTRIALFQIQSEYNCTPHAIGLPDEFTITSNEDKIYVKMKSILNLDTIRQRKMCGCEQSTSKCPYNMTCSESDVIYHFSIKTFEEIEATKVIVTVKDVNDMAPVCTNTTLKIALQDLEEREVFDLNTTCKDEDYSITNLHYSIGKTNCAGYLHIRNDGIILTNKDLPSNYSFCQFLVFVSDHKFVSNVSLLLKFQVCPADIDSMEQEWEDGIPGSFMYKLCPSDSIGTIKRFCSTDGVYEDPIYNCTAIAIHNILNNVSKDGANIKEALHELSEATSSTGNTSLSLGDIDTVTKILSKISDVINTSSSHFRQDADKYVEVASNILQESTASTWQRSAKQTNKGAESVVENIDRFTEKVASKNIEIEVPKPNLYLKIGLASNCDSILRFPRGGNEDEVPEWANGLPDEARIPCSKDRKYSSYSGVLYKNLSKMVFLNSGNGSEEQEINAPIVSFSLYPKPTTLDKPIEIKFGLYNKSFGDPKCSYWSETTKSWSTEGCRVKLHKTMDNTVTCECNHLTNFAILMSPKYRPTGVHHEALSTITIIGCIFSMVCLCLTIIMYAMFWRYVQSVRAIIHINMSCSLFVAYLLFIIGIDQTQNYVLCKAVAIVLHLTLLLLFFTMMVEGLNLAYMVLKPMSTRKPGIPLLIGAYILTFIVVGIALAIRFDAYGGEQFCWLTFDHGSIWAFLGPAIIVCSVNVLIIIAVLWKMFGTAAISKRSGSEKARTALRNIAVLMPTMGLSWILGIFAVNEDTVIFQYLFAIANSLQGLLIFILHVVLHKKIKEAVMHRYMKWQSIRSVTSGKSPAISKSSATSGV